MSKKIIFSGGGTGGHILPAINLMNHFNDKGYEVLLITDSRGSKFIKKNTKFKSYLLNSGTPTNKNILKKLLSYFLIFYAIIKSVIIIKKEKPYLIFGLGGYVSFPISFASRFFNLPLVIYENNIVLGRTNRHLASLAKKILIANKEVKIFSKEHVNKTVEVGPVLNKNIINCKTYKKNNNKFSILILGGSQGAQIFSFVVPNVIKMLKNAGHDIEINQQCTSGQKYFLSDFYNKNNIKSYVFEYEDNILKYFLSSNIAITRCGASTTAELVHTFTPFIAIPLPNSIDDHQYLNAKYYEKKGFCWFLDQEKLNDENLFNIILEAIKNKSKLNEMSRNMEKNSNKNVYSNIENELKKLI